MALKDMPLSHTTPEISRTFKLYNFCVNHTDYSIDWNGFFILCDFFLVDDIEDEIEFLDLLRRLNATRSEARDKIEKELTIHNSNQNEIFLNSVKMIKEKKLKEKEEALKLKESKK